MSRGINKFIGIGNLGKDPETRYLPSGAAVCNFSIAISESWKDKQSGEQKERTEWVNVEVWGNTAEACQKYLTKGSQCYVEGKMQTDKWQDKEGNDRWTTKIRADSVQFLGSRGHDTGAKQSAPAAAPAGGDDYDDDIPF